MGTVKLIGRIQELDLIIPSKIIEQEGIITQLKVCLIVSLIVFSLFSCSSKKHTLTNENSMIIENLKKWLNEKVSFEHKPISVSEIESIEEKLGYSLPPLLKLIYTEVFNGEEYLDLYGVTKDGYMNSIYEPMDLFERHKNNMKLGHCPNYFLEIICNAPDYHFYIDLKDENYTVYQFLFGWSEEDEIPQYLNCGSFENWLKRTIDQKGYKWVDSIEDKIVKFEDLKGALIFK